jgi:hypothetical protein
MPAVLLRETTSIAVTARDANRAGMHQRFSDRILRAAIIHPSSALADRDARMASSDGGACDGAPDSSPRSQQFQIAPPTSRCPSLRLTISRMAIAPPALPRVARCANIAAAAALNLSEGLSGRQSLRIV